MGKEMVFFAYCFDSSIAKETLKKLGDLGFYRVIFCVDAYHQWFWHCKNGNYYDMVAVAQNFNFSRFSRYFRQVKFIPILLLLWGAGIHTYRYWLLARMGETGIPLDVYGKQWKSGIPGNNRAGREYLKNDLFQYLPMLLRNYGPLRLINRKLAGNLIEARN